MRFLKEHFFPITVIAFLLLTITASYYRFVTIHDYYVSYEADCDPAENSCFIGCEDDECTEEYYYSNIERHAQKFFNFCMGDVTDCDEGYFCTEEEGDDCSITFCDPGSDGEDACYSLSGTEI